MKNLLSLLLVSFILSSCNSQVNSDKHEYVNEDAIISLIENEKIEAIDVRTPGEVDAGYVKGTEYFFDINNTNFKSNIDKLDKNKPYILICRSGARSSSAAKYMIAQGFTKVYELKGGLNSWKKFNYLAKGM